MLCGCADGKDADEMGAVQTVTACNEIIPVASDESQPEGGGDGYLTVNMRYKLPGVILGDLGGLCEKKNQRDR